MALAVASGRARSGELGDMSREVLADRLANPLLGIGVVHPVAADQHLLIIKRQPGDLPADDQALEEHLLAARPDVLGGGRIAPRRLADLLDRPRAQPLAQRQHVPLGIGVVHCLDRLALAPASPQRGKHFSPAPPRSAGLKESWAAGAVAAPARWYISTLAMMIQIPLRPNAAKPAG